MTHNGGEGRIRRLGALAVVALVWSVMATRLVIAGQFVVADLFGVALLLCAADSVAKGRLDALSKFLPWCLFWLALALVGCLLGESPATSFGEVTKELYLWSLAVSVATVVRRTDLGMIEGALVGAGVAHAAVIGAQYASPALLEAMSQGLGRFGETGSPRPIGLMLNPNMAAILQAMSAVIGLASPRTRWKVYGVVAAGGVVMTGSNAGMFGLLAAVVWIACGWRWAWRKWAMAGVATIGITGMVASMQERELSDASGRLVALSIGRMAGGEAKRWDLWEEGLHRWSDAWAFGVGPGVFRDTHLEVGLHNDLIATLVERGVFGLVLLVTVIVAGWRALGRGRRVSSRGDVACPWLEAVVIMLVVASMTHEVVHFRFVWIAIGLAYCARSAGRKSASNDRSAAWLWGERTGSSQGLIRVPGGPPPSTR